MRTLFSTMLFVVLAVTNLLAPVMAAADPDDREGGRDHPMFTRMPGYFIDRYLNEEFAQYKFKDKNGKMIPVEGRFYKITYTLKKDRTRPSTLQVIRNHTNAVRKIGGAPLNSDEYNGYYAIQKGGMETWAHVHAWGKGNYYTLAIIEKKAMEQAVLADAAQMAREIKNNGKVALYGIYFDTDKAIIKPESAATIKEIAGFLKENPSMKIYVVGHTDSDGSFEHNDRLSGERAKSVVRELTGKYGIATGRLAGYGVGPLCPVRSNKSGEGKAKNRRVELVER